MAVFTTFRLADPLGQHLIEIANYISYDYVLNCAPGNIGVLELELPRSFNTALLMRDGRIGAWRSINGRAPYLDNGAIYLIETLRYTATSDPGARLSRDQHHGPAHHRLCGRVELCQQERRRSPTT
jgi:hypothetical protein